ncbi:MAG: hypothetical protein ACRDTD_16270 [Pseudonocardiaceae bacterium]
MEITNDIRRLLHRFTWMWRAPVMPRPTSAQHDDAPGKPGGRHRQPTAGRAAAPVGRTGARFYHPPPSHRAG